MRTGMKQRKIVKIIVLLAGLAIVVSLLVYLYQVMQYQNQVKHMTFQEIDLAKVEDGEYIGACDVNFIYAKVQVTVEAGAMKDITILKHKNDRGKAAEQIVGTMIKEQQTNVDAITSATNSSKVIRKAVELAIAEGLEK